ncbi:MAG: hypothetical protein QUS09_02590, partial [Methanotrichaceae archaeon]|nr:hypothetical protein [Methanotrichaceae archaeon]
MANILVGAAIILVPLGLFLFIMARDLNYEEKVLMRRVARLQRAYYSIKPKAKADAGITDSTHFDVDSADLDEADAKLIRNIASTLKADNIALAFNKAI